MPRSCRLLAPVAVLPDGRTAERLTVFRTALLAGFAFFTLGATAAQAQGRSASDTPLHVPASHFEFVASGERGAAWLVALPRQSAVAPDELATVGTLCVDATGLSAGTYRATAAVAARGVQEPVAITITLVVTDAGARARPARCGTAVTK